MTSPTQRAQHPDIEIGATRDAAGYTCISHYGVLGDGRAVALVAVDGNIDWWALKRLDSAPAFAAVLDPERGGTLRLAPTSQGTRVHRRYLQHTNQLESLYRTVAGSARVLHSLNSGSAGALPWGELALRIEGVEGRVEFCFLVRPGDGIRQWQPWVETTDRGALLHAGTTVLAPRCSEGIVLDVSHEQVTATFTVDAGQRVVVGLVASTGEPLFLTDAASLDRRIDATTATWRQWCTQVQWTGAGRDDIVRSSLALKTLMITATGAVAAAATTSLPENVGGPKNWDYRFSWVRDAALTIDALADLGLEEEVHAAVTWLLRAVRRNGPRMRVMYTLDGELPGGVEQPDVPGYRHSVPVQVGNQAAGQTQLGVFGDLFGTVADWVFRGHVLDTGSARQLADLADECADTWRHDDAGLWELLTERPYTISKMNCWRALDAAARLAQAGLLVGDGRRWRAEAKVVRRWVKDHCWSAVRNAYSFYAGSDELDAAVVLGATVGFDTGAAMSTTIDAIGVELGVGPLLYRYSGAHREEATFTACAYWRVHALACVGRAAEARTVMGQLTATGNDVGLMSEMVEPDTGELIGNVPQALSHLAYIKAATALRTAENDAGVAVPDAGGR